MKKTLLAIVILLTLAWALPARAESALDIKLNFFGPAVAAKANSGVTTSFFLKSLVQRNLQVKFAPESLLDELRKTFNTADATLLATADLEWRSDGPVSVTQVVQIDGRDYVVALTPLPKPGAVNFKVGVLEEKDQQNIKSVLLDTEIVLPNGEVAMLGFRDSREHSYFIAFYVQERSEEFGKGAVRLSGSTRPKKVKHVNPIYPEEAVKKKLQGVVILEAVIDVNGKVKAARTITSGGPLLDEAALAAVKQWVYEPYAQNDRCKEVLFTVTVTFALDNDKQTKPSRVVVTRIEGSQKPKLVRKVNPVYPPAALDKKIAGTVVLEAVADETGKVIKLQMVKSPDQILTDAAVQAVKQWVYEPFLKDGEAKKVCFTVTVTFSLKKD